MNKKIPTVGIVFLQVILAFVAITLNSVAGWIV